MMVSKENRLEIEKSLWTHDDFEKMGWHDSMIYSMCFEKDVDAWTANLIFDIDYIFKWVHPHKEGAPFTFWVATYTLIFEEAFGLKIHLKTADYAIEGFEISDLKLVKREKQGSVDRFHWIIELQHGEIEFMSNGLKQIVRKRHLHVQGQQLTMKERGGISFDKTEIG